MLSGMRKSVEERGQLVRHVSEQGFAKARATLSTTAMPALNDWLVARAAGTDQIAFGLYLSGVDMMLAASLRRAPTKLSKGRLDHSLGVPCASSSNSL
jgi:hypothetical protein